LLLLALLLRAAIPAGMMLAPAPAAGLPRIVPCPGTIPALGATSHHGAGHHAPDDRQPGPAPSPCPFAVLSLAAAPPAPLVLAAPPMPPPVPAAPKPVWHVPEPDAAALLPPATGPPALP
jgi:hypothetical protein